MGLISHALAMLAMYPPHTKLKLDLGRDFPDTPKSASLSVKLNANWHRSAKLNVSILHSLATAMIPVETPRLFYLRGLLNAACCMVARIFIRTSKPPSSRINDETWRRAV